MKEPDEIVAVNSKSEPHLARVLFAIEKLRGAPVSAFLQIADALVEAVLVVDHGDLPSQLGFFQVMSSHVQHEDSERKVRFAVFSKWVRLSENEFAKAYRNGLGDAEKKSNLERTKKAVNGRRLIGATTRERIKEKAPEFAHLTKEKAAHQIAGQIGKSGGTVLKLLIELFPGDQWRGQFKG